MHYTLTDSLVLLFAYLIGSIPFGLLLTRFAGLGDIRQHGSGNIGATNVLRLGGKKLALMTLLLDAGKGVAAVILAKSLSQENIVLWAAALVVLGHIFPLWLKFKGGKGVATALSVFATLSLPLGIFISVIWLTIFKLSRISSLSAIIAFFLAPFFAYVFTFNLFPLTVSLSSLIILRHYKNIIRLLRGFEPTSRTK